MHNSVEFYIQIVELFGVISFVKGVNKVGIFVFLNLILCD